MTKITYYQIVIGLFLFIFSVQVRAETVRKDSLTNKGETFPKNWYTLDPQSSGYQGVSVTAAYEKLLAGKPSQKVLIAVIDSGTDTSHPALKPVLWTNLGEIPDNGVDDDKNGYVDDVHGWSFVGDEPDTKAYVRYYYHYLPRFGPVTSEKELSRKELPLYKEWLEAKELTLMISEYTLEYNNQFIASVYISQSDKALRKYLNRQEYTLKELAGLPQQIQDPVKMVQWLYKMMNCPETITNVEALKRLQKKVDSLEIRAQVPPEKWIDPRAGEYAGKGYGNKDVQGKSCKHGTHVAGIIAGVADKTNGFYGGIARNAEIMIIRAVPVGDERDKDVANAIRYAVDNGAQIINMSFVKHNSIYPEMLEKAMLYAKRKGVLLVHAVGNERRDIDTKKTYPYSAYGKKEQRYPNLINVVGSTLHPGKQLLFSSSNYGKKNADILAPAYQIFSCIEDGQYGALDGTSMAAPIVSGIAAVLKSYYPELTASQLREIILESVVPVEEPLGLPNQSKLSPATDACLTGGTVNLYRAVLAAEKQSKTKR